MKEQVHLKNHKLVIKSIDPPPGFLFSTHFFLEFKKSLLSFGRILGFMRKNYKVGLRIPKNAGF